MISCTNVYKYANEAGGGEPSDSPSANYDKLTSEARIIDTDTAEEVSAELALTEDEFTLLRKHRRTVVTTDTIECKVILIGRWTLNNQYEEDAEVRV